MNILVTGGAGYIGSATANLLLDKNNQVTIVDNLSTGDIKNIPRKAHFIKTSIDNKKKISNLLKKKKFDLLIHFAAFIDVEESVKKPQKYYKNNFLRTLKLLKICKSNGINKLIFSSTASVYGNSNSGTVYEHSIKNPVSPYALSKLKCENFIKKEKKIKYVILRYFNVAGADLKLRSGLISKKKSTHLIKKICENYINKKSIEIFGKDYPSRDGTAIRDYIHVADLANAHFESAKYLMEGKKSVTFNCGYGTGYSVRRVIDSFNKLNKRKLRFIYGQRRKGDIFKLIANTNKIKKILNWKPKHNSLPKILSSSLNWEKKISKRK